MRKAQHENERGGHLRRHEREGGRVRRTFEISLVKALHRATGGPSLEGPRCKSRITPINFDSRH